MKYVMLSLLLLGAHSFAVAQAPGFPPERYEKVFDFSPLEVSISAETRSEYVQQLAKLNEFLYGDQASKEEQTDRGIHFLHLNGDALVDAIYHGFGGGEAPITVAYVQAEGGFGKWWEHYQTPVDLEFQDKKLTRLFILDQGCCDAYMESLLEYAVSDQLEAVRACSWVNFSEMGGEEMAPVRFEVTRPVYHLRDSPFIDNKTYDERLEREGNVIASMTTGQRGTAYRKRTDSTGRVWWLVVTDPVETLSNSIFYYDNNYPKGVASAYVGWMSSRFVTVLD